MEHKKLIGSAKQAMQSAYVPYSGFKVGAALLTQSGFTETLYGTLQTQSFAKFHKVQIAKNAVLNRGQFVVELDFQFPKPVVRRCGITDPISSESILLKQPTGSMRSLMGLGRYPHAVSIG